MEQDLSQFLIGPTVNIFVDAQDLGPPGVRSLRYPIK